MKEIPAELRQDWQPPPRPEWVARINEEGSCMDIRSVVPLDADSLLETAQANTGLSDFGEDGWQEPFEIIARALDDEAELNLMGRLMCRSDMLIFLEGRLRIEDTYKKHPDIENERIEKPLFIIGQGRTGTSALLNLLARDSDNGTVRTWEAMFPCPPPEKATYETDPRIEKADRLMQQWNRVTPSIASIHEFNGTVPAECVQFMVFGFTTIWFNLLGQIPSYVEYMGRADWEAAYRYHTRILKLLQWKNPRRRWLLKSPEHLRFIPVIRAVYPDAGFIWTHRDPAMTIASANNFTGTLNWMRSDHPFRHEVFAQFNRPEFVASGLEAPIGWLERGELSERELCNILYADFVRNPLGSVERIYDQFGIELRADARAAMERYLREQPRSVRPRHEYQKGSTQLIARQREIFERYQARFNVPNEI